MLGPGGRRVVVGPRRRRPIWPYVVVGLLLALLVGEVADQVVASSPSAAMRGSRSWVAAVSPLVEESNSLVPALVEVRDGAPALRRLQLEALLEDLTSGSDQVRAEVGSLRIGPPSTAAGAELAAVMDGRARASAALASAVDLAIAPGGGPPAGAVASELAAVARELGAADAEYRSFRRVLPRRAGASRLPASVWLEDPARWQPGALSAWAASLAGAGSLVGRRAISLLAVSLEPRVLKIRGLPGSAPAAGVTTFVQPAPGAVRAAQQQAGTTTTTTTTTISTTTAPGRASGTSGAGRRATTTTSSTTTTTTLPPTTTTLQIPPPGSVSLVQATSKIVVTVVVVSSGNLAATGVEVGASLMPLGAAAGSGAARSTARRLGTLVPGAARSVAMAPLAVTRGGSYRLAVTASLTGGAAARATIRLQVGP